MRIVNKMIGTSAAGPAQKRKRVKTEDGASISEATLVSLWQALCDCEDGGFRISAPFMDLPAQKEYADYYHIIKVRCIRVAGRVVVLVCRCCSLL